MTKYNLLLAFDMFYIEHLKKNSVIKKFKGDTYQSIHPGSVGQENQKCQHHYWEQKSVPSYLDS